ncbi:MAG: helix-turn-helix transcriptional regulator [Gemmatimonadales bacterium]|nr:helix-turn-helix transcriptional regulator [Gemmatimonadales bacterium]
MSHTNSIRWVVPDREWRRGVLDPIVLYALSHGVTYGYELIRAIRVASGGEFDLNEGTVYPVLYRLERAELVRSEWGESGAGARRKHYVVTAAGNHALETALKEWQRFVQAVNKTLGAANIE